MRGKKCWGVVAIGWMAISLLMGCKHETYESGDGRYSYLQAHYVEAMTNGGRLFVKALTDDDTRLTFTKPVQTAWATTADSTYRALLYHKRVMSDGSTEPFSLRPVPVVRLRDAASLSQVYTDPVVFESAWVSANKKYLNISFALKTGKVDDKDKRQQVMLVLDRMIKNADGTSDAYIRVFHRQNSVPEYYQSAQVMSLPLEGFKGRLHLTVNTYKGKVVKMLTVL